VRSIGFTARRLPPLAPQVSQISDAALIEREAVTMPPLAEAAAIEVQYADALTVAGFAVEKQGDQC